jgi:hypothetical protein
MAIQNKITVGVDVTDNGSAKKTIKNVDELHGALKRVQNTAENINVGGTAGSRKAAAAGFRPAGAAAAPEELTSYGVARGTVGTGASARDFAKQAQGLGGLVHLYATYAANVFAVGAAFRALSAAMDTENMVKGLNQLGAASGIALGSLSKQFVQATDGAVSLREAMEATVKASSSGMNSEDILRMGIVAKQAAQALGVDMVDAVSRITRGITKLEPELLDELGIFTRVGIATEAYAKSVNKSVNSLTDFERRMAFANAVLAEGEKKFGEIQIDTNPYTKLLASIKDVAQSGLELVNKVLTPIVKLLSESPTALTAVLAGIGTLLIKQALPAIGQVREGLKANAEAALEAADAFKASFGDEFQRRLEQRFQIPDLTAQVQKAQKQLDSLKFSGKLPSSLQALQQGELQEKNINALLATRNNLIETGMRGAKKASEASISAAKTDIQYIEKSIELYKKKQAVVEAQTSLQLEADKPLSRIDPEVIALKQYEKLRTQVDKTNAISAAAENARILGVRGSWQLLNKEIAEKGITGFAKFSTIAQGGIAAVGSRVMGLVSAFGNIGMAIGAAVAVFGLLNSWLTKTNKESQATASSLSSVEASTDNLKNTFEAISKKDPLESFNIQSISARANALESLTSSLQKLADTSNKEIQAMGNWDKLVDWTKSLWGGDVETKLSSTISKGLVDVFSSVEEDSTAAKAGKASIQKLLKIDNITSLTQVDAALSKLSSKERQSALLEISNILKKIGDESKITAAKGTELEEAFRNLSATRQKIEASFIPKDDISTYGSELLAAFSKLSIAVEDPVQKLNAIKQLSREILEIPGATLEEALGIQKLATDVENLEKASLKYNETRIQARNIEKQISELIGDAAKASKIVAGQGKNIQISGLTLEGLTSFKNLLKQVDELRKTGEINLKIKTELTSQINNQTAVLESAQLRIFKTGTELITKGLSAEWAKAGTTIANAYASVLAGTETGIKMRAASERAVISAQIAQVEAQRNNTIAVRELAIQLKEQQLDALKANSSGRYDAAIIAEKEAEIIKDRKVLQRVSSGDTKGLVADVTKDLESSTGKLSAANTEGINFARNMEASAAAVANLRAQIAAVNIGERFAQYDRETKEAIERQQSVMKKSADTSKGLVDSAKLLNGEYSDQYTTAKQTQELNALNAQQQLESYTVEREIQKLKDAGAKAEADKANTRFNEIKELQQIARNNLVENQRVERINNARNNALQIQERSNTLDLIKLEGLKAQEDAVASIRDIQLNQESQTKQFTGEYTAQKQYELETFKIVEESKRAEQAATIAAQISQMKLAAEYDAELKKSNGIETDAAKFIREQMAAEASAFSQTVTALQTRAAAQLSAAAALREFNKEQAKFGEIASSLQGLDTVFDGLGTSISNFAESFKSASDSQKQYANTIAALDEKLFKAKGAEEQKQIFKEINETQKKQQKDEISGYAKTAGAAKAMFKEKTAAHKALAQIEKVLHLQRLAMDLKEMVQKLFTDGAETTSAITAEAAQTGANQAGFLARSATYIKEIYAKFSAAMGPWGWAAAAAVIASIFGGGGSKSGAFVPTSEQRQETQGTAMSYDSRGELVQTSRGVFGDTSAKSESIVNSLEIIRDNSIDGLDYDNKMLRALEGLRNALDTAAKGLYGITGLRAGSLSGIVEGENTSGGLFGIGGLFSKSVSKSIVDSGLKLSGSLQDLINGVQGTVQTFETVSTTVKKSGFFGIGGSTKTSVSTQFKDLAGVDQKAFNSIVNAFGYAGDLLYDIADTAGISAARVSSAISSIRVDEMASLRGLTGEDFTKELSAVIGKILDDASYAIFSEFEQYANFGEGMLETVVRVVDTNKKVNQALLNLGNTNNLLKNYDISEALVNAAGGLENFIDKAEYFRSNFLTEAEQIAPVASAVSKELKRLADLGYTSADGLVDSRSEFKKLVQSIDLTSASGQEAYTSLMNVAEGFYEVTEITTTALEDTISKFTDFAKTLREFRDNLVLGSSSILTPLQKYAESKLQFEETYTKALAGDEDAQGKLTSSAQTFLTASKDYFASSAQYTQDFNSVLDKVGVGITSAESQISIAERQLNGITEQVGLLTQINENIAVIAGVPQMATGGRASGLTFVGERGPELVNFTSDATVYSNEQTRSMFSSPIGGGSQIAQVVGELVQVRRELTQLRNEQRQQTGDLITSNYDANLKAANQVTAEITNTANDKNWQQRNQVVVV